MGKFSAGLITGTMLGVGMMLADKKTIKKAKKIMRKSPYSMSWI